MCDVPAYVAVTHFLTGAAIGADDLVTTVANGTEHATESEGTLALVGCAVEV